MSKDIGNLCEKEFTGNSDILFDRLYEIEQFPTILLKLVEYLW